MQRVPCVTEEREEEEEKIKIKVSMACMNIYSSEHQSSLMVPRISFSSDFAVDPPGPTTKDRQPDGSGTTDFEFSATEDKYSTVAAADELFFKGRLLPLKQQNCRTLKDELLANDDEDEEEHAAQSRPAKLSVRWKGLLGMKGKAHHHPNASRDADGNADGSPNKGADANAKAGGFTGENE